jgi:hypothetical protein
MTCVYRKLKHGRSGDEVRPGWRVNGSHRFAGQRSGDNVSNEKRLIAPKAGDCNDYAVTKRHQFLTRGWTARALLLAEVLVS